jgi:hypothetical protein
MIAFGSVLRADDEQSGPFPTLDGGTDMVDKKNPPADGTDVSSELSLGRLFDNYVPDTVKRALFTGAGMLFMTEEGVRKAVSEFNLPREAVNYLVKQSEKGKAEFFANLQKEMHWFLSRIDVVQVTRSVLDDLSLDVQATFTLRTKKTRNKPPGPASRKTAPAKKKKRGKG